MMRKDENKDKEHQDGETAASSETVTSSQDAHQSNRDLSQDQEARDAALAKTITEAVTREMAKAHAQYQALLNDRSAAAIPTSLKVTSGANGFKVMDPFDWTKDKAIYQRWQLWSEKARLTLNAMEGDSEKTKISYFHHWINGEGMGHIESWKNKRTFIHQSEYDRPQEQKEGKYSSESMESYFTLFESLQVKSIVGCRRITLCQARLYDIWRISFPYCENCKKMPVPQPRGRRKGH